MTLLLWRCVCPRRKMEHTLLHSLFAWLMTWEYFQCGMWAHIWALLGPVQGRVACSNFPPWVSYGPCDLGGGYLVRVHFGSQFPDPCVLLSFVTPIRQPEKNVISRIAFGAPNTKSRCVTWSLLYSRHHIKVQHFYGWSSNFVMLLMFWSGPEVILVPWA